MVDNNGPPNSSRRSFLKIGVGVVAGAAVSASVAGIPLARGEPSTSASVRPLQAELASANVKVSNLKTALSTANSQVSSLQGKVGTLQAQSTGLQAELDTMTGFIALNAQERSLVEAIVETIIPSDSSGPGAKEAGVLYFIDRQLATDYGKSGHMYMQGPFVPPNLTTPVTVAGTTYPGGTMSVVVDGGQRYQYGVNLRAYWRIGLQALEAYATSAYGSSYEQLTVAQQTQALTDLWNNKPTSFNDIVPQDFFYELYFMTWAGFLMDPLYGGNKNMVGWTYTGFNGLNMGNFYGEGLSPMKLMVATTPTRLQPASLAQYQKGSP